MDQLTSILALIFFISFFGAALIFVSSLFGPKAKPSQMKASPYECGIDETSGKNFRVSISFYLTAILFILFDIEIIFMYPWAVSFLDFIEKGEGLYILSAMGFFIFIFAIGLLWEIKSKALEWD